MFYFIKKNNNAYILSGGALIGFGSFGCIYNPSLKTNNKKLVSKIGLIDNLSLEIEILNRVGAIDPEGKFHSKLVDLPIPLSVLDTKEISKMKKECYILDDVSDINALNFFNIEYSGDTNIDKFIKEKYRNLEIRFQALFFVKLGNILRGLYLINQNKIYHNDVQGENIIIDTENFFSEHNSRYSIKLIDFGNSKHDDSSFDNDLEMFLVALINAFDFDNVSSGRITKTPVFDFGTVYKSGEDDDYSDDDDDDSFFDNPPKLLGEGNSLESEHNDDYDEYSIYGQLKMVFDKNSIILMKNYCKFIREEFGDNFARLTYSDYFSDLY